MCVCSEMPHIACEYHPHFRTAVIGARIFAIQRTHNSSCIFAAAYPRCCVSWGRIPVWGHECLTCCCCPRHPRRGNVTRSRPLVTCGSVPQGAPSLQCPVLLLPHISITSTPCRLNLLPCSSSFLVYRCPHPHLTLLLVTPAPPFSSHTLLPHNSLLQSILFPFLT